MRRTIFSVMLAIVLMPGLAVAAPIEEADLSVVSLTVLGAPAVAQVGESFDIFLQIAVTNGGPSGPVDAVLTSVATAPPGSSILPTVVGVNVEDLAVSEVRTILEPFSLILGAVGQQTFNFVSEILVVGDDVVDPNPSNNSLTLSLEVVGVPVPTTLALTGLGLAGIGYRRRKQIKAA
jgi:hypothetical protein